MIIKKNCRGFGFEEPKVHSLFKDGKQTAGCTEFRTETGLRSLVSVRNSEHPAVCLPSLKREPTLTSFTQDAYFSKETLFFL